MFLLGILASAVFFFLAVDGKLARHTLDLTWDVAAPDGTPRKMVLTNGAFPGPQLSFDENDDVEVLVHNHMPFNTTVHWHGIEQHDTPWSDGVPGLSQSHIQPGTSFNYRFTASPAGTYWYHSHSQGLLQDGQFGAIFIRRLPDAPAPFKTITNDLRELRIIQAAAANPKLVLLTDWTKFSSLDYFDAQVKTNMDLFCVDSILFNGKGAVNCQSQSFLNSLVGPALASLIDGSQVTDKGCMVLTLPKVQGEYWADADLTKLPPGLNSGCKATQGSIEVFEVDAKDRWVSLNFIGGQSLADIIVSLDEHPMWIYEVDGGYVEPRLAHTLSVYHGERYAVLVKLDRRPANYTLRAAVQNPDQLLSGYATFAYNDGEDIDPVTPYLDYGGTNTSAAVISSDREAFTPYNVAPPSASAQSIHFTHMGRLGAAWKWALAGKRYTADRFDAAPLLYYPNSLAALDSSLVIRTLNGSWVDIVLQTIWNDETPSQPPHPIHKHSNKAYVIGQGEGLSHWESTEDARKAVPASFNLINPPYRDTFVTSPINQGWIVIRYQVITPGAFLMHCHIDPHLESGMAIAMLDGVDQWPRLEDPH